ncbi:hypothetical protein [Candidatus Ichthyocystis hellenicum]|uniref:hypothetical protein n=1 Tax=Candidatus Ichthyocystis hellenicum TaxID=1561003 RepID=UPI000B867E4C|nr:hypothetical protein [Candidatus Ichthyocystis hellenicum]
MQGLNFAGNVVPVSGSKCYCEVCDGYSGDGAVNMAGDIHERCTKLFTDEENSTDPEAYVFLLRRSNCQELEEIEETVGSYLVDGKIILKNSISAKFMIALAVLLALLIVAFILFTIGTYGGVFSEIPEVMVNVVKWFGSVICIASLFYLLLGVGYLTGYTTTVGKERKQENVIDADKIKLADGIQKTIESSLRAHHRSMQSCAHNLKTATDIPDSNTRRLLNLQQDHLCLSYWHRSGREMIASINSEIVAIRSDNETKVRESGMLAEKNAELSGENAALKSKLNDLLPKLGEKD